MLGSSASVADANTVLNTAVASVLRDFADRLEGAEDFAAELHNLIRDTVIAHKRILFNGNGYDDAWLREAEKRGLSNYKTTPEALAHFLDEKNVRLFTSMGVLSETELRSRSEIYEENYAKILNIEALTMIDMTKRSILPAVSKFAGSLAESASSVRRVVTEAPLTYEEETVASLSRLASSAAEKLHVLENANMAARALEDSAARAMAYKDTVLPAMTELRVVVDGLETLVSHDAWPYPSYGDLLYSVR